MKSNKQKTNYPLMQVKSIAECSFIKLPFAIKIFVLSIFECPFYTGFTVFATTDNKYCHIFCRFNENKA